MTFYTYKLVDKTQDIPGVHVLHFKPTSESIPPFKAGQYVVMRNPQYTKPEEQHLFSIASPPQEQILEFCIREYGFFTQAIGKLKPGDLIELSSARGAFIVQPDMPYIVFLCGGVGISTPLSILRDLEHTKSNNEIMLLYGSRTQKNIVYKKELEILSKSLKNLSVKHVFSEAGPQTPFEGYQGFITEDIIKKEVDLHKNPHWYITGPPVFIKKMEEIVLNLHVSISHIHTEQIL